MNQAEREIFEEEIRQTYIDGCPWCSHGADNPECSCRKNAEAAIASYKVRDALLDDLRALTKRVEDALKNGTIHKDIYVEVSRGVSKLEEAADTIVGLS